MTTHYYCGISIGSYFVNNSLKQSFHTNFKNNITYLWLLKYNILIVTAISAIVMTLAIPHQSFAADVIDKLPGEILDFQDCSNINPKVPFTRSVYVLEGDLKYNFGNGTSLNTYDKKDVSLLVSNYANFKNRNDTTVDGLASISTVNSSKHIGFTVTATYLKCYSSIDTGSKESTDPLKLPLSNSCPVKDIYIKGTTFSKISQKEGVQPSKTFKLQIDAEQVSKTEKEYSHIWGYMNFGDDSISLSDVKIDSACILVN